LCADRLAGEASAQDGAVMDRSDILNALREIGRSSDSVQYCVSETMDLLQDLRIQRGIFKREHHAGITKRIINQHMTGTNQRRHPNKPHTGKKWHGLDVCKLLGLQDQQISYSLAFVVYSC
jgi:hypothetical protein